MGYLRGLNSKQIDEKLSKIVEFSELENFINIPITAYSSYDCKTCNSCY